MKERCILVAEDDTAIRLVLEDALQGAGFTVLAAADGRKALELALSHEIDLLLLDINMPELNGFKLLQILSKECPGLPSIILTAHGEEQERVKGLELGADDYVVKPFSLAELKARINAVLRRTPERSIAPAAWDWTFPGGRILQESREAQLEDGSRAALTEREFELFRYFLTHPGRIISQEELLLRVWNSPLQAKNTRTVAVTLTRLRDKIGPQAAACFENVRGRGYKWNQL